MRSQEREMLEHYLASVVQVRDMWFLYDGENIVYGSRNKTLVNIWIESFVRGENRFFQWQLDNNLNVVDEGQPMSLTTVRRDDYGNKVVLRILREGVKTWKLFWGRRLLASGGVVDALMSRAIGLLDNGELNTLPDTFSWQKEGF